MDVRDIARRLGLKRHGREWRGTCPACGYGAGAFVLEERSGHLVWWCASCQDRAALTRAVLQVAGTARDGVAGAIAAPAAPASAADRTRAARSLWDAAPSIAGTLAAAYLAHRGVLAALTAFQPHAAGAALRFLPRCRCTEAGCDLPAMLAAIRNPITGDLVAVHRTWLVPPGRKAALAAPKKSLGPVAGAAIMLHAPRSGLPLVIAEGIETALAASVLLSAPAWTSVSAGNMPALHLPDGIEHVVIAADPGAAGEGAAGEAALRWRAEGRRVQVALPDDVDADFADLLLRRLAQGGLDG